MSTKNLKILYSIFGYKKDIICICKDKMYFKTSTYISNKINYMHKWQQFDV